MSALTLDVAGWRVGLSFCPRDLAGEVARRYRAFLSRSALPVHLHTRVGVAGRDNGSVSPAGLLAEMELRFPDEAPDQCRLKAPGAHGHIDLAKREGRLLLDGAPFLASLEYYLRVAYALLAIRDDGLLIHAAGLCSQSGVYLFIGHSGSGKSTVVALSHPATALNDDLVLLRRQETSWMAYGTPFWNSESASRHGETASGPVTGIYRLVQDRKPYIEPLLLSTATAELVGNCPVVNASAAWIPALIQRCTQLASEVRVCNLHFRKDAGFWELLQ